MDKNIILDKNMKLSGANTLPYKRGNENTAHGPPGKLYGKHT